MAAQGFRAFLSRLMGRAVSEGTKAATRELDRRTQSKPTPKARSGRNTSSRNAPSRNAPSRNQPSRNQPSRPVPGPPPSSSSASPISTNPTQYPGDFTGKATLTYAPRDDGRPDPGEVVWAWVPFEEDHSQGKDRPVLVIAHEGKYLLGLMLTSKDHDRDQEQDARHGRFWLDVGTGAWDRQNRPSEVRLDRVLQLDPAAVRREGAVLDRNRYDEVAAGVRHAKHW
jgi:hypothetical protein